MRGISVKDYLESLHGAQEGGEDDLEDEFAAEVAGEERDKLEGGDASKRQKQ